MAQVLISAIFSVTSPVPSFSGFRSTSEGQLEIFVRAGEIVGRYLMAGGISATRVRLLLTGWEIQASPAEGFDSQVTGSHSLPSQIAVSGSARNRIRLKFKTRILYLCLLLRKRRFGRCDAAIRSITVFRKRLESFKGVDKLASATCLQKNSEETVFRTSKSRQVSLKAVFKTGRYNRIKRQKTGSVTGFSENRFLPRQSVLSKTCQIVFPYF